MGSVFLAVDKKVWTLCAVHEAVRGCSTLQGTCGNIPSGSVHRAMPSWVVCHNTLKVDGYTRFEHAHGMGNRCRRAELRYIISCSGEKMLKQKLP